MLAKSRAEKRHTREPKLTDGEVFMPDDKSAAESTSTWGVVNVDSSDSADPTEELRVPSSKLPWAISETFFLLIGFRGAHSIFSVRKRRPHYQLHRPLR